MHREDEKCIQNFGWKTSREKTTHGRIILKWILRKQDEMVWTGSSDSG
jgi:hypothetical protein